MFLPKALPSNTKAATVSKERTFPAYFTHHGPVMGKREGKWLT
jgi:hypothetical protein